MKLPSLAQIWAEYSRTIRRFPLTLISAAVATVAAITLVEYENQPEVTILYSVILSSVLALPLLTTLKLTAEKASLDRAKQWGLQVIGIVLLVIYAFTVPDDLDGAPMIHMFRFFAFAVGLCLLFSVLTFSGRGEVNGFWQFNKIVVFRIVLAGVFAVVLFAGLGLALAALDNLFGMNVPPKRYGELWILINGFFTVGFILAGIPDDLNALDAVTEYPKGLRVFAQYVLAPLVLVYFVILYAYIAKIIVTWNWPQGWVGRLILGFSATGILALFVLDPIKEQAGQRWLKRAARWYYAILIPLVVMLFLALWRRISEYGVTEDRYLGLAIGVWLAVMAGYFIFSRTKSIKIIPASLCILTFALSFGPWGMFAVSERSQISRLRGLLVSNSILVDGTVQKAPGEVSEHDVTQISSILWYLGEVHGYDGIQGWFAQSLHSDSAETRGFKGAVVIADMMGIRYSRYPWGDGGGSSSYTTDLTTPITVSGYDHIVRVSFGKSDPDSVLSRSVTPWRIETAQNRVVLKVLSDTVTADSLVMDLHPLVDSVTALYGTMRAGRIPAETATSEFASEGLRARMIMLDMFIDRSNDTARLITYDALILYSLGGVGE